MLSRLAPDISVMGHMRALRVGGGAGDKGFVVVEVRVSVGA